jgi:hypothetical protein
VDEHRHVPMAIGDEREGDNLQALAVVPVLVTLFAVQATPTKEERCRY